ncbi:hypothetical protein GGE06_004262 [Streptomyces sp. SFB5A]|uniref:Uncharacterized protein n=1 Tax=Streptomyces nymphaeiformis TaxID=2663842 RepID=A0A7W7U1K5_9ACTN|nr:hypothetical protein [Streptomyces nymphaeiformis]
MPRVEDHFTPAIAQLIAGILGRREGRRICRGLGAVPRQGSLPHQKVGERQKKKPCNDRDIDRKRLPLIVAKPGAS